MAGTIVAQTNHGDIRRAFVKNLRAKQGFGDVEIIRSSATFSTLPFQAVIELSSCLRRNDPSAASGRCGALNAAQSSHPTEKDIHGFEAASI